MRKRIVLLILSLCTVLLSGCGSVIELTDEETQLIAEYSAELLLKYDINYVDRMDDGNQKAEELASEEMNETIAEDTTEEQAKTEESSHSTETTTEKQTDEEVRSDENSSESLNGSEAVETVSDIAKVVGVEGISIKFRDYLITDQYPETTEQEGFLNLEATDGYQLLVLQFDVRNEADEMISFSMLDKEMDYHIVCNDNKAANPMLTILMEDLGTLETVVEPGETQEAVLVFQISEEMKEQLKTMDLYITYNEKDNIIHILQ